MHLASAFAILSLAGLGLGLGIPLCLLPGDVTRLVNAYKDINTAWDDAYADFLSSDFTQTSDSVNILQGKPLGSVTYPTKAGFITFQQNRVRNPKPPHLLVSLA